MSLNDLPLITRQLVDLNDPLETTLSDKGYFHVHNLGGISLLVDRWAIASKSSYRTPAHLHSTWLHETGNKALDSICFVVGEKPQRELHFISGDFENMDGRLNYRNGNFIVSYQSESNYVNGLPSLYRQSNTSIEISGDSLGHLLTGTLRIVGRALLRRVRRSLPFLPAPKGASGSISTPKNDR